MLILLVNNVTASLDDSKTYYSLDDANLTGNDPIDLSGNSNNGESQGGLTTGLNGIIRQSFGFDNTDDYVNASYISSLSDELTISFWFNMTGAGEYHMNFVQGDRSNDRSIQFQYTGTNVLRFSYATPASGGASWQASYDSGAGLLSTDTWHHLVVTRNGSKVQIYVDGSNVSITPGGVPNGDPFRTPTSNQFQLGTDTGGVHFAYGSMDEFGIWNRTLTPTEVSSLYNGGNAYNPYDPSPPPPPEARNVTITLNEQYARNSSNDKITVFNTSKLSYIETVVLNLTVETNSSATNISSFYLNFTAGGKNGCSLGNLQSRFCYNFTNSNTSRQWVQFIYNQNSGTYDGTKGNQGDRIIMTNTSSVSNKTIIYTIDEHYNPNVFKHYSSLYNFSNVKWQTGVNQVIHQNNQIKVCLGEGAGIVPLDADQYKLDFRVNHTVGVNTPNQPLEAWICNSNYSVGDVTISPDCSIVAEKNPSELQDDGTKFRAIFTKNLVDSLTDIDCVILRTSEVHPNRYYYLKTYQATTPGWVTQWNYTNNQGTTWNNLGDGYESELNFNWFYNGANPTVFKYLLKVNTTSGEKTSYQGNISWEIDPSQNYPPLLSIITPVVNETITIPYNITWLTVDPNDDPLNVTINILDENGTLFSELASNLSQGNTSYLWNITTPRGSYAVQIISCETNTTELYCVNDTHNVTVSDTPPTPPTFVITPSAFYFNKKATFLANGSTDINNDTITIYYQVYNVDDSTVRQAWSTTNTYTPLLIDVDDTLMVFARAVTITANSTDINFSRITFLSFANFTIIREKTNSPFNMSNVDEMTVSIICQDDVIATVLTKNNVALNISCPYEFIKVDAVFGNTSYFRIINPSFASEANITVYMLDLTNDTGVEIIITVNDLTGEFGQGEISIDRFIDGSQVNIIGQPFDIQNSVTLFLLKDALYTVTIENNVGVRRVIGNLIASSAGTKILTVPQIIFYPQDSVLGSKANWNYSYDNNNTGFITLMFKDLTNQTKELNYTVYNSSNEIVFFATLSQSTNNTMDVTITYSPLQRINDTQTYTSLLVFRHDTLGTIRENRVFTPTTNVFAEKDSPNVLPGFDNFIFWAGIIILIVLGLSFDANNSKVGLVVFTIFFFMFVAWEVINFAPITAILTAIFGMVAVINFVSKSRRETGGD